MRCSGRSRRKRRSFAADLSVRRTLRALKVKGRSLVNARTDPWAGVLLGTLAASVVLNLGEIVVHGVVLAAEWQAAVALLGKTLDTSVKAWAFIVASNSLHCAAVVGLGALLRLRFESTMKAAVVAATAVWAVGWVAPTLGSLPLQLFPLRLWGVMLAAGLVELIAAAVVGQWVYRRCVRFKERVI